MSWQGLAEEIANEFEELAYHRHAIRSALERFVAQRAHGQRIRSKRQNLFALRRRLRHRPVIACRDPRCGVEFVPYRNNTKYCSNACRIRWCGLRKHHRRRAATAAQRVRSCRICHESFVYRKSTQLYCSSRCRRQALGKRPHKQNQRVSAERLGRRMNRVCGNRRCRQVFTPRRCNAVYCGRKCCFAAWYERHRATRKESSCFNTL